VALWGWIAVGAGSVLVGIALVVGAIYGWRAVERRYLLRLISRREAVYAVRQALEDALSRLAEGSDEQLHHFSQDADALERRTLHEVWIRARILSEELDTMPLPRRLIPAAQRLADAAHEVSVEAGKVHDDDRDDLALEALASIDLSAIAAVFDTASVEVSRICTLCSVEEDASVYGGGLYL
jgi:hypothetical protein